MLLEGAPWHIATPRGADGLHPWGESERILPATWPRRSGYLGITSTSEPKRGDSSRVGRLAAANACPCRLSFSPGICRSTWAASSGKSARRTSLGHGENERSAGARGDPAEHEHVTELVDVCKMAERITEVGAQGQVHVPCTRVSGGHERLHLLESRRERQRGGKLDACGPEQSSDGLLRQVLHAAPVVPRPLVARGIRAVVDRDEGDLVEPWA